MDTSSQIERVAMSLKTRNNLGLALCISPPRQRIGSRRFGVQLLTRAARLSVVPTHNKQLQRTVIPNRWRAASAAFHYALAARWTAQRAAAELRR
jgi:hypothetical protein